MQRSIGAQSARTDSAWDQWQGEGACRGDVSDPCRRGTWLQPPSTSTFHTPSSHPTLLFPYCHSPCLPPSFPFSLFQRRPSPLYTISFLSLPRIAHFTLVQCPPPTTTSCHPSPVLIFTPTLLHPCLHCWLVSGRATRWRHFILSSCSRGHVSGPRWRPGATKGLVSLVSSASTPPHPS